MFRLMSHIEILVRKVRHSNNGTRHANFLILKWKLFEDTIELSSLRAAQNCSQNGQPTSSWCWDTFGSQDTFSTTDLVVSGADVTRITESISCRLLYSSIFSQTRAGIRESRGEGGRRAVEDQGTVPTINSTNSGPSVMLFTPGVNAAQRRVCCCPRQGSVAIMP